MNNIPYKKILSLIFLLSGFIFVCSGLWKGYKNNTNPSFICIDGIVLNSIMESYAVPSDKKQDGINTYFKSKITYEYSVNGTPYKNSTMISGITINDSKFAKNAINSYPEGRLVSILYNPQNPEDSLLKTFSGSDKWIPIAIGSIFIILGVLTGFFLKDNDDDDELIGSSTLGLGGKETRSTKPVKLTEITNNISQMPDQELTGRWKLNYQMPSMVEIVSHAMKHSGGGQDVSEILSASSDSAILTITGEEMVFSYKDADNNGSCEIISKYLLNGDELELEHQSMDFLMVDIEDFPPNHYTYKLKGSTLILTTKKIKGLGNKKITYHMSKEKH